jgi:N-acetylglucosamine-6-sulfatase
MSERIGRRDFLKQGSLAGLAAGSTGCAHSTAPRRTAAPNERRPNFLFVMTDDQNWQALGCAGHPFLRTPNMDRVAREGVTFENAFVTTSVCSPSRASFLTGVHAHVHGVINNEDYKDPAASIPNMGQLLQAAGYETAFLGKWHMGTFWDAGPRPGFDHWLSFPIQGEYVDPVLNENGRTFQAKGYVTDLMTDAAVDWLRTNRERPFCLCLWHKAAHSGFIPADRHKDAFADAVIPEPPNYRDTYAGKPEWLRALRSKGGRREKFIPRMKEPVPADLGLPEPWDPDQERTLNYYRTLLAVDESLGRLLETLDSIGRLDNTVVIFTSDNGFFLGAHRLSDKRLMYEESIRIPMLVRYPKRFQAGSRAGGMALNIDLLPTILDLAEAPVPDHVQGKSLVGMMEGRVKRVRESFLYTYFREEWLPGYPLIHGVRSEQWKYIRAPEFDDIPELYDLENDPLEMRNLAEDAAYGDKVAEMAKELGRLLEETRYPTGPQKLGAFPPLDP